MPHETYVGKYDGIKPVLMILCKYRPLPQPLYDALAQVAAPEIKERVGRYRKRGNAENTLLGRALAGEMISIFAHVPKARQRLVAADVHGKPILKNHPHVHFNISHSGAYVACGLAPRPLGVDVQTIKEFDEKLVRRFFTKDEAAYVLQRSEDEARRRFCRIWTMKESYIKRSGKGLATPLESFDVLALQGETPGLFSETALPNALCQVCY